LAFLDRFARDEWNIGIVHQTIEDIARHGIEQPVHWFPADSWRIFADPFCVVQPDGGVTIMAELLNHWVGKGEIWTASVHAGDDPLKAKFHRHITGPVHLSYPSCIQDGAVTYATMESYEAGGLFLWRRNGDEWHFERTLLTGPVVDATIYRHGQFWWLFCTFGDDRPDERLHLFYSRSLLEEWRPHPANPIKDDRASARPAGALFQVDGKLIRPSQNSSKTYGGSLVLNHVVALTPEAFQEVSYRHILPQSQYYADGIHTIAAAGSYTVIDGKRWHYGSANLVRALVAKAVKMHRKRKARKFRPQEIALAIPSIPSIQAT
jgi:hypothetical protein